MRSTRHRLTSMLAATVLATAGTSAAVFGPASAAPAPSATPAAAPAPQNFTTSSAPATIRYGDHNWSVVCLQQGLNYLAWMTGGRVTPAGNVDGIFGARTLSSVRSLQAFAGVRVDGVVGRDTGEELAKGLWYGQSAQNVRDWLIYCQHTIPRHHNYPAR